MSRRVSEMMTICRTNYPAEQNTINQREGFAARRGSSQPLASSRVFILRTSHFTTIYSSSESIYVTLLILARCFDTQTDPSCFSSRIPNLCVNYSGVLDSSGDLWPGHDPGSGVVERRERKMRGGSTPSDSMECPEHFAVLNVRNVFEVWKK